MKLLNILIHLNPPSSHTWLTKYADPLLILIIQTKKLKTKIHKAILEISVFLENRSAQKKPNGQHKTEEEKINSVFFYTQEFTSLTICC